MPRYPNGTGAAVSLAYEDSAPFEFSGLLNKVIVELERNKSQARSIRFAVITSQSEREAAGLGLCGGSGRSNTTDTIMKV